MLRRFFFAVVLVIAGFAFGLVLTGRFRSASDSVAAPADQAARTAPAAGQAAAPVATLPDFSAVASRASGGIVNISSVSMVRRSNSPFANDPFFRQFFGGDDEWFGSRLSPQQSLGSGVTISPDCYLGTNNHVVSGNLRDITTVLADKREVHGQIVGRDPATDIAVIRINARNLPVVPWGDSSRLKVGQWVLAIGSPFQLNQTVTLGIVSAIGRAGLGVSEYEDFIQTDAAINPGNSGGGLVDTRGELIGINTAILSEGGGSNGVGFAVPSNLARRIADELIRYGEVRRGSIGMVRFVTLTPELAEQLGIKGTRGALVYSMYRTSPAYEAGIRPGDVVVRFNGQAVEDDAQLRRLLSDTKADTTARVDVVREGRRQTIEVPVVQQETTGRD
ncbi:MAG: PDZ domain-containing protein [Acidobacteria bacterium]|nr:MAG: PDZ domain-containing protein [Acidobacteriota bacterium]